jgi:hypothetical protein
MLEVHEDSLKSWAQRGWIKARRLPNGRLEFGVNSVRKKEIG